MHIAVVIELNERLFPGVTKLRNTLNEKAEAFKDIVGLFATKDEAFDRWLHDGGAADVPLARLSIADGLAAVRAVGARASLAHPHQHGDKGKKLLRRFHGEGLDGVEAYYGRYDAAERDRWLRVADDLKLTATGGSDWHGEASAGLGVELPEARGQALLAWLGRA